MPRNITKKQFQTQKRKRKLEEEKPLSKLDVTEIKPACKRKKKSKTLTYESARKKQLVEANHDEDKNIKRLEKLLKLNKRKKKEKKLPTIFQDDGLDYLLDVIDKKEENVFSDCSDGIESDLAMAKGVSDESVISRKPNIRVPQKKRTLTELLEEKGQGIKEENNIPNEDFQDEDDSGDDDKDFGGDGDDDSSGDEVDEEIAAEDVDEEEEEPKVWEDIYGRIRDKTGSVIKNSEKKYLPPKLKNTNNVDIEDEECVRIKRQLKGLLNRLSESNLQNICHQIEEMYMKFSRNNMNETLFKLVSELSFTASLTPPLLIMVQAMLVSLLHADIGSEIGAYFLQSIVQKLASLFEKGENYGEGKECNNLLIFLSHLYNFKVTSSALIFDIFNVFIKSFRNKDIELIQLLLKNIGFMLRKDDPLKLKEMILSIQAKSTQVSQEQNDSRIKFMLETLTAIRNNNMYKIPDYDPSIVTHAKKVLKGMVRKGVSVQELAISYDDLLNVEGRGRWWIVGSAWTNTEDDNETGNDSSVQMTPLSKNVFSEKILELARKQHMNTDVRKSVFCIIMTAEDFMDAFEKLLKLNLKNQQEREIINVILHCTLQEKKFNPYYAYLVGKFCSFARKYQMCLQFSLWDKFKDLTKMKKHQVHNLAQLLSHLFTTSALPLSVLKVIHFSDMDKLMVKFFRQILFSILLHDSEEVCDQVFRRIAPAPNLKLLREGLRLFMHHFLLRNDSKLDPEVAEKLRERVKLAESALNSAKNAFKL